MSLQASLTRTRKIALEEHFMTPELVDYWATTFPNIGKSLGGEAYDALIDLGDRRLEAMDAAGIEFAVLSLAGPGVQAEPDTAVALRRARAVNDLLATEISKRPRRYGGFAHLAMQDPTGAADELERSVRDLGLQGAMINGVTNGLYLDDDRYGVFWERAAALRAPIYIHPNNPADRPAMYADHPELWGPVWSWGVETATHALRLVFAGVFEHYPDAIVILGHMGEAIPFQLWRIDSRWDICNRGMRSLPKPPSHYIRQNIRVTTSGVCSAEPLQCALSALGADHVMFSVDYPFERTDLAASFIETVPLDHEVRIKVAYANAERVFGLKLAQRE